MTNGADSSISVPAANNCVHGSHNYADVTGTPMVFDNVSGADFLRSVTLLSYLPTMVTLSQVSTCPLSLGGR